MRRLAAILVVLSTAAVAQNEGRPIRIDPPPPRDRTSPPPTYESPWKSTQPPREVQRPMDPYKPPERLQK